MTIDTSQRLARLRQLMTKHEVHAYIIPSEDAHQSEYIAPCDGRRAFISGFTGSAGFAVVTLADAALWTDGRYFLQASKQLDSNWTLMKQGMQGVPTREKWLNKVLSPSSKVGIDPKLITVTAAKVLKETLSKSSHILASIEDNLVDAVWGKERPAMPHNVVNVLDVKYAGKSFQEKIKALRDSLESNEVWGFVVTALDEIAWLFNLRGSDIPYNPVFFSYALVTKTECILYVDNARFSKEVSQHLGSLVTIRPYDAIFSDFKNKFSVSMKNQKLWIDSRCNLALQEALGGENVVKESRSPVMTAKSIKNATELEGFRQCHRRDAAALCNYFAWLENELVVVGNKTITEVDGADKLEKFRSEQADFVGLSFDTISSTGPNGAIIHYKPEPESCSIIDPRQLYLCDSGGQYKDGTTDTTRTLHFTTPSQHEKECFTRVLKGHIQIDIVTFPTGTTGYILDVLARNALWKDGLDFRHGTGHGVGHFLNVHEGPQGIGQRIAYNDIPLEVGMTVTDEPGYYEDGKFGIRIENVILVRPKATKFNFGNVGYLGFEHVTVVPIQTKLIEKSMLTPREVTWVNEYNKECFDKVSGLLEKGGLGYKWLEKECKPF